MCFFIAITNVTYYQHSLGRLYTSQNMWKRSRNVKNKKCVARYFASLFSCFAPLFLLFAFHNILCQGWRLHEKSKHFVVYLFAALIKHEIHMKYEKCIVSVSYFVMCFVEYPWNAKFKKCIAGLIINSPKTLRNFCTFLIGCKKTSEWFLRNVSKIS